MQVSILSGPILMAELTTDARLIAAFIYGYELLKVFPPTWKDIVHHAGWIGLTLFVYRSPLATEGSILPSMIRIIAICSFFSLGLNNVILLGNFLIMYLGSWARPPRWMCLTYGISTWAMCLSRPLEWILYLAMYRILWQNASHITGYVIMTAIAAVLFGIVSLHREWSARCLKRCADLWGNFNQTWKIAAEEKDKTQLGPIAKSKTSRLGSFVVDGIYCVDAAWLSLG
jgi:hypothetical protein